MSSLLAATIVIFGLAAVGSLATASFMCTTVTLGKGCAYSPSEVPKPSRDFVFLIKSKLLEAGMAPVVMPEVVLRFLLLLDVPILPVSPGSA